MKTVFIGSNLEIANLAWLSVRPRWLAAVPRVASTAADGLELVNATAPDLVFLHPSFADMSLAETILEMRRFSSAALVVLSDQGGETEALTAMELGADDYIALPCDQIEMIARIRALMRLVGFAIRPEQERSLYCGELLINPATQQVLLRDHWVSLTSSEFRLLHLLIEKEELMERVMQGNGASKPGLVEGCVPRLRYKLEDTLQGP